MNLLKILYWDLGRREIRYRYVELFLRNIPGRFGERLREKWYRKLFKRCGRNLTVSQGAFIVNPHNIECGDNVFFGLYSYIQAGGGLVLGSDVLLGPYVRIWTQNHLYKDKKRPVWQQGYEYKRVVIGNDVWIGANVFIMPGAEIGDKCIVAANSVVSGKKYPEGLILAGYPARKVGVRQ